MGAVLLRRRLQVAHAALTIGIMLGALRVVTGQTEPAVGHERRDGRGRMARVATGMRFDRRGVGIPHPGTAVTAGAVARRRVVPVVTGAAALDLGGGGERDGCRVAFDAAQGLVRRMREIHDAGARGVGRDGYGQGLRHRRRELRVDVTIGARGAAGCLVMTDLAAAWRHEREAPVPLLRGVTGDAGELFVAVVRECVGRSRGGRHGGDRARRPVDLRSVTFLLRPALVDVAPRGGRAPQRLQRVERHGRIVP